MACHVPREHISLTMTSRDMRFPSMPFMGHMRLPEVCVHAYCVLEQLMACHVPREHISHPGICVSPHAMSIAKVCMHAIVMCAYTFLKCVCIVYWSCSWLPREHITA